MNKEKCDFQSDIDGYGDGVCFSSYDSIVYLKIAMGENKLEGSRSDRPTWHSRKFGSPCPRWDTSYAGAR